MSLTGSMQQQGTSNLEDSVIRSDSVNSKVLMRKLMGDMDFPYYTGVLDGLKCCTKCGATKTPQWREGPYGPKTLCNACGVKRTRKLRAEQDGYSIKRRRVSPQQNKKCATKTMLAPVSGHVVTKREEEFLRATLLADEARHSEDMKDLGADGSKRPTRRAAEEAAYRTARYAKTGEWSNAATQKKSMFRFDVPAYTPTSSSEGGSLPLSDCPEEIAWTPQMGKMASTGDRSLSPDCVVRTPDDCFAAINLMTMSAKYTLDDTYFSSGRFQPPAETISNAQEMHPSNSDVEAALGKAARLTGDLLSDSDIAILSRSVPPSKVAELIKLSDDLDSALSRSEVAEAALSAVAAILASKQAAVLQNRSVANSATEKLKRFIYDLDTQFGLTHKVLPKIRVTPLKKTQSI